MWVRSVLCFFVVILWSRICAHAQACGWYDSHSCEWFHIIPLVSSTSSLDLALVSNTDKTLRELFFSNRKGSSTCTDARLKKKRQVSFNSKLKNLRLFRVDVSKRKIKHYFYWKWFVFFNTRSFISGVKIREKRETFINLDVKTLHFQ